MLLNPIPAILDDVVDKVPNKTVTHQGGGLARMGTEI